MTTGGSYERDENDNNSNTFASRLRTVNSKSASNKEYGSKKNDNHNIDTNIDTNDRYVIK